MLFFEPYPISIYLFPFHPHYLGKLKEPVMEEDNVRKGCDNYLRSFISMGILDRLK